MRRASHAEVMETVKEESGPGPSNVESLSAVAPLKMTQFQHKIGNDLVYVPG